MVDDNQHAHITPGNNGESEARREERGDEDGFESKLD
jgi:hypothetical protein